MWRVGGEQRARKANQDTSRRARRLLTSLSSCSAMIFAKDTCTKSGLLLRCATMRPFQGLVLNLCSTAKRARGGPTHGNGFKPCPLPNTMIQLIHAHRYAKAAQLSRSRRNLSSCSRRRDTEAGSTKQHTAVPRAKQRSRRETQRDCKTNQAKAYAKHHTLRDPLAPLAPPHDLKGCTSIASGAYLWMCRAISTTTTAAAAAVAAVTTHQRHAATARSTT